MSSGVGGMDVFRGFSTRRALFAVVAIHSRPNVSISTISPTVHWTEKAHTQHTQHTHTEPHFAFLGLVGGKGTASERHMHQLHHFFFSPSLLTTSLCVFVYVFVWPAGLPVHVGGADGREADLHRRPSRGIRQGGGGRPTRSPDVIRPMLRLMGVHSGVRARFTRSDIGGDTACS